MQLFGFDTDLKWDYENGFYLTSPLTRISKLLAHYELYKSITHLPGHIIECGVYKGASFIRFCTFRELLESPYSRKIIGFDAFGKFPRQGDALDQAFIERFEGIGGEGISAEELEQILALKSFSNYELIEGDILQTIPEYLSSHPELKISLLHIDVDVYNPTRVILETLFDRIVPDGLVVLDDYGTVAGETRAADEFFLDRSVRFQKLPISHIPIYIKK